MTAVTVEVFTKPGCQPCAATKRHLDNLEIPHQVHDITEDDAARQRIIDLGYVQAPVVIVTHALSVDHWSGYKPDNLAALHWLLKEDATDE